MKSARHQANKTVILLLILVITIQTLFIAYQFSLKKGFFIDELYSYGLSNSHNQDFLNNNNEMQDKWSDTNYFNNYLTVQKDERFDYVSVYINRKRIIFGRFLWLPQ